MLSEYVNQKGQKGTRALVLNLSIGGKGRVEWSTDTEGILER